MLKEDGPLFVPEVPLQTYQLFKSLFSHSLVEVRGVRGKDGERYSLAPGVMESSVRASNGKLQKGLVGRLQRLLVANPDQ